MDTDDSKEKLDWSMELNMGIEETRMLYDAVPIMLRFGQERMRINR